MPWCRLQGSQATKVESSAPLTMHLWWAATFWLSDSSSCPHSLSRLVLQKEHLRSRAAAPLFCPDMTKGLFSLWWAKSLMEKKQCKQQDSFILHRLVDPFNRYYQSSWNNCKTVRVIMPGVLYNFSITAFMYVNALVIIWAHTWFKLDAMKL